MIQIKMLVKCIDNTDCPNCLTLDKEYKVVTETKDKYNLVCNHDQGPWLFSKKYFVIVKEKELVNG